MKTPLSVKACGLCGLGRSWVRLSGTTHA